MQRWKVGCEAYEEAKKERLSEDPEAEEILTTDFGLPFLHVPELSSDQHLSNTNYGRIVEICGDEGTGKTECLLHCVVQCIMPQTWKGRRLSGLGKSAVWIDNDYRFSILRLASLLEHRLQSAPLDPHAASVSTEGDIESIPLQCSTSAPYGRDSAATLSVAEHASRWGEQATCSDVDNATEAACKPSVAGPSVAVATSSCAPPNFPSQASPVKVLPGKDDEWSDVDDVKLPSSTDDSSAEDVDDMEKPKPLSFQPKQGYHQSLIGGLKVFDASIRAPHNTSKLSQCNLDVPDATDANKSMKQTPKKNKRARSSCPASSSDSSGVETTREPVNRAKRKRNKKHLSANASPKRITTVPETSLDDSCSHDSNTEQENSQPKPTKSSPLFCETTSVGDDSTCHTKSKAICPAHTSVANKTFGSVHILAEAATASHLIHHRTTAAVQKRDITMIPETSPDNDSSTGDGSACTKRRKSKTATQASMERAAPTVDVSRSSNPVANQPFSNQCSQADIPDSMMQLSHTFDRIQPVSSPVSSHAAHCRSRSIVESHSMAAIPQASLGDDSSHNEKLSPLRRRTASAAMVLETGAPDSRVPLSSNGNMVCSGSMLGAAAKACSSVQPGGHAMSENGIVADVREVSPVSIEGAEHSSLHNGAVAVGKSPTNDVTTRHLPNMRYSVPDSHIEELESSVFTLDGISLDLNSLPLPPDLEAQYQQEVLECYLDWECDFKTLLQGDSIDVSTAFAGSLQIPKPALLHIFLETSRTFRTLLRKDLAVSCLQQNSGDSAYLVQTEHASVSNEKIPMESRSLLSAVASAAAVLHDQPSSITAPAPALPVLMRAAGSGPVLQLSEPTITARSQIPRVQLSHRNGERQRTYNAGHVDADPQSKEGVVAAFMSSLLEDSTGAMSGGITPSNHSDRTSSWYNVAGDHVYSVTSVLFTVDDLSLDADHLPLPLELESSYQKAVLEGYFDWERELKAFLRKDITDLSRGFTGPLEVPKHSILKIFLDNSVTSRKALRQGLAASALCHDRSGATLGVFVADAAEDNNLQARAIRVDFAGEDVAQQLQSACVSGDASLPNAPNAAHSEGDTARNPVARTQFMYTTSADRHVTGTHTTSAFAPTKTTAAPAATSLAMLPMACSESGSASNMSDGLASVRSTIGATSATERRRRHIQCRKHDATVTATLSDSCGDDGDTARHEGAKGPDATEVLSGIDNPNEMFEFSDPARPTVSLSGVNTGYEMDLSLEEREEFVISCLARLYVYHCRSNLQLIATLEDTVRRLLVNALQVKLLLIDNVAAYYYHDKKSKDYSEINRDHRAISKVTSELADSHSLVVLVSKSLHLSNHFFSADERSRRKNKARTTFNGDQVGEFMSFSWRNIVHQRILVERISPPATLQDTTFDLPEAEDNPLTYIRARHLNGRIIKSPAYVFRICHAGILYW
eukprot:scpid16753/ scgid2481/ DNA repair protein XRCC2 homolog; X-ray repair cross-complementing protein 2 homolog